MKIQDFMDAADRKAAEKPYQDIEIPRLILETIGDVCGVGDTIRVYAEREWYTCRNISIDLPYCRFVGALAYREEWNHNEDQMTRLHLWNVGAGRLGQFFTDKEHLQSLPGSFFTLCSVMNRRDAYAHVYANTYTVNNFGFGHDRENFGHQALVGVIMILAQRFAAEQIHIENK